MAFDSIPQLFNALTNSPPALPPEDITPVVPGGIDPTYVPYPMPYSSEFLAIMIIMFLLTIVAVIAFYVYTSIALMTIAKKTKTPNGWLAWIPIGNLYLMTQIAKVNWAFMLVPIVLYLVYLVSSLLSPLLWIMFYFLFIIATTGWSCWMWWKIAEARNKPGWWGILMLIPIANFVIMGLIAWKD